MQTFRERADRHPIALAVLATLFMLLLSLGLGRVLHPVSSTAWFASKLLSRLVSAIAAWALLRSLSWTGDAGLRPLAPGTWVVLWLPAVVAMSQVHELVDSTAARLAYAIPVGLAIGLAEELWHRGVILRALRPLGGMRAALLSALLFSLMHLGWLDRRSVVSVAYMEWYTFALGVLWAALVIRTGSLWPGVVFHGLMDMAYYDSAFRERRMYEPHPSPPYILLDAVMLTYGLYLISTAPQSTADPEPPAPAAAT